MVDFKNETYLNPVQWKGTMSFNETLSTVELTSTKAINASIMPLALGTVGAGADTNVVAETVVSKQLIQRACTILKPLLKSQLIRISCFE